MLLHIMHNVSKTQTLYCDCELRRFCLSSKSKVKVNNIYLSSIHNVVILKSSSSKHMLEPILNMFEERKYLMYTIVDQSGEEGAGEASIES